MHCWPMGHCKDRVHWHCPPACPDVWEAFSDSTREWLKRKGRMQERLDDVNRDAKRQLNNEKKKPIPKTAAAKTNRVKRLDELKSLNDELERALRKVGITDKSTLGGKYRVLWEP